MPTYEVRACRAAEIFDDPASAELFAEYARECSIPEAEPQRRMYEAMEQSGALQGFGAYVAGELVGFVTILSSVMPHHGKRVATIESLFVLPSQRDSGAGNALLSAAKQYASESGCVVVLYTARIGSRLETVLYRRSGCKATHTVFSEWL